MIADVEICRVHKSSPFNIQAILFDIEGKDEIDIYNNIKVQKTIDETFGRELRISISPVGANYYKVFYVTKEKNIKSKKNSMQELIKIKEQNGNRAVSARELHQFLEVETQFTKWCERMFEYGFQENEDFILVKNDQNKVSKSNPKDYALTIDTAKEISMIQRTDKGKQARQYFIAMEKVATNKMQISDNTPKAKIGNIENQINELEKKVELLKTIKTFLIHGDFKLIAKDLNVSETTVRNVISVNNKNPKILKALYDKALENKANKLSFLFNYQQMIDMLKK